MKIFDFFRRKVADNQKNLTLEDYVVKSKAYELIEVETEEKLIAAKRRRSAARRSREDGELWNNWRNYGNHPLDSI